MALDYGLYDADMHYFEPEDCFTRFMSSDRTEEAIRVVQDGDGSRVMVGDRPFTFLREPFSDIHTKPGSLREMLRNMKSGLPIDWRPAERFRLFPPIGWLMRARRRVFGEYGLLGNYKSHPDKNQEDLFFGLLKECLEAGTVTEAMLRDEMAKNHVRHDAFDMLDRVPDLAPPGQPPLALAVFTTATTWVVKASSAAASSDPARSGPGRLILDSSPSAEPCPISTTSTRSFGPARPAVSRIA